MYLNLSGFENLHSFHTLGSASWAAFGAWLSVPEWCWPFLGHQAREHTLLAVFESAEFTVRMYRVIWCLGDSVLRQSVPGLLAPKDPARGSVPWSFIKVLALPNLLSHPESGYDVDLQVSKTWMEQYLLYYICISSSPGEERGSFYFKKNLSLEASGGEGPHAGP